MKLGSPWQNPGSASGCQGHPDENCHLDVLTTTKQLYHKLPACLLSFGTTICFAFKIYLKFITAKELNSLFITSVFLQKSCVAHIVPYVCLRIVVDNYLQLLTQFACCFIITLSPKRLHPIRIAVSQVIKDVDYGEKTHNKSENCGDNYSLLC